MAHFNASDAYFGTYARFQTEGARAGAALAGPDNAIGDMGDIEWREDACGRPQAWLRNPYGHAIGFLDAGTSHTLAIYRAKGWAIRSVLSIVAYSDEPAPGSYWGEAALIAYAPRYAEQFEAFLKAFAHRTAEGLRPDPDLGQTAIEGIIADSGSWEPSGKVRPARGNGRTAILKDHRTLHDKLLDQARSGKAGCYIVGWGFIAACIALAAWAMHALGVF